MTPTSSITTGSHVRLHYRIRLEDGSVVESTFEHEAVEFVFGDGTFPQGLEYALLGKRSGEKDTVKIGPELTFGFPEDGALVNMPRSDFPADMPIAKRSLVNFKTPAGDDVYGVILDDSGDPIRVDFNHPLAGHEIEFEFEVLEVK